MLFKPILRIALFGLGAHQTVAINLSRLIPEPSSGPPPSTTPPCPTQILCCQQVTFASNKIALLRQLGITLSNYEVNVGVTCTPTDDLATCNGEKACCQQNNYGALQSIAKYLAKAEVT